jgi:hypothetical protein
MADNRGRIDSTTESGFRDAVGFINHSSSAALADLWRDTTIPVDGAPVTFRVAAPERRERSECSIWHRATAGRRRPCQRQSRCSGAEDAGREGQVALSR